MCCCLTNWPVVVPRWAARNRFLTRLSISAPASLSTPLSALLGETGGSAGSSSGSGSLGSGSLGSASLLSVKPTSPGIQTQHTTLVVFHELVS